RFSRFWPGGEPSEEQIEKLNRRKPGAPCEVVDFADGTQEKVWCTFDREQMDLDLNSETAWNYVAKTLRGLMDHGAAMIRL
ncbi:sucrose phosphorylase, partial [Klebsiella oxytoca]